MPQASSRSEHQSAQAIARNFARVLRVTQTHWSIARNSPNLQAAQAARFANADYRNSIAYTYSNAKPVLALELAWQWGG